jgi:integrase
VLRVRKQLSRATKGQPARRTSLKTTRAERDIDLAPELERMLREHRAEAFKRGHAKQTDFVFATLTEQPVYYRNAAARGVEKGADRAGLNREGLPRLGFHDLRHTAITHLIRSGADVAQV